MTQTIKGVRDALYVACKTIYAGQVDGNGAPVLVCYGPPASYQANHIIAVGMRTQQPIARPTMGTNRSREKAAVIDIIFSTYVPGGDEAQQTASDACDDLIELLDAYFRAGTQSTLGGACREAWLSDIDGPNPKVIVHPESGAVTGRSADATISIVAHIRY